MRRRLFATGVVALCLACKASDARPGMIHAATGSLPGLHDVGTQCLDVAARARACFGQGAEGQGCAAGRCLVARPVARALPPSGLRCSGQRAARRCEARSNQAGPFHCEGGACVQSRPRMPDAGEWLCVDMDGVVYCRGTGEAAGVGKGARDPAFVCGRRRAHQDEEICVDLSPDPPPGLADYQCRIRYASGTAERVCTVSDAPQVGGSCEHGGVCPDGSLCMVGVCLPAQPQPACWFDEDCGGHERCRWGSCIARD